MYLRIGQKIEFIKIRFTIINELTNKIISNINITNSLAIFRIVCNFNR
jgi:hypothetical protein